MKTDMQKQTSHGSSIANPGPIGLKPADIPPFHPGPVDLHVHSYKSDGSLSPAALVSLAKETGLSAFALTDHDTTEGIDEALDAAKGSDLTVIPGIELSTEYEGKDVHIVGLYIDYKTPAFQAYLKNFQDCRDNRNHKMCAKLREHGVDITYEKLRSMYPDAVLTRSHYAGYLLANGYVKNLPEAFERFIGDRAPCFVPREKITPAEAVTFLLENGGIPVLAHPILYHMSDARLEKLVASLKEAGLIGIEAIYATYSAAEERQIRALARKYDLCISGGSDFHGVAKPNLSLGTGYGNLYVPYEILETLRSRK